MKNSPLVRIAAKVRLCQRIKQNRIDGRMQTFHAWMLVVPSANKAVFQIGIDQLGSNAMRKRKFLLLGFLYNFSTPLGVTSIKPCRCWQVCDQKLCREAHSFKNLSTD